MCVIDALAILPCVVLWEPLDRELSWGAYKVQRLLRPATIICSKNVHCSDTFLTLQTRRCNMSRTTRTVRKSYSDSADARS
jgi:hypothetical protein